MDGRSEGTYGSWIVVWVLLSAVHPGDGSLGDRNAHFQECVLGCRQRLDCPADAAAFGWTQKKCFDCRYACMWATVAEFQARGYAVPQFCGKWPFSSISFAVGPLVFLVQEPASTLFSLFNLCGCVWLWNVLQTRLPDGAPLRRVWVGYSLVGIGAWICSMVFHSRDFWLTEYFDYFAAGALIFYAFFASLMVTIPDLQRRTNLSRLVFAVIFCLYIRHVHYLFTRPSFDYGHNMFCCIGLSVLTAGIYVAWALREWYRGDYRPSINTLLLTIGIGLGAAVFEVFDFAPVFFWSVDAHSLFHLATVPTPVLLGRFALAEAAHRRKGLLEKEA